MLFLPVMLLWRSKTKAEAIWLTPSFLLVNQMRPVYYLLILLTKMTFVDKSYFKLVLGFALQFDGAVFFKNEIIAPFVLYLIRHYFIDVVFEFYVFYRLFPQDAVELNCLFIRLVVWKAEKKLTSRY